MELIVFYIFKCRDGDEIRLKQYAGILVIEFWDDLIYNMDTGKAVSCVPDHCQHARVDAETWRGRPVGISRFISNISGFIPSRTQWSSNDALIVWGNVSGRFIGPIK